MELPTNLLKAFAQAITEDHPRRSDENSVAFGTISVVNGEMYVILDGSEELTPVSKAMDAVDGDRVIVSIRNHSAIVTGNITSPASARTASSFMKLLEQGLVVGELDSDDNPDGVYFLIGSGAYRIIDIGAAQIYSSESTYNLGDHVVHNNMLYRCIVAISEPEDWTAEHWVEDSVALFSPNLIKLGGSNSSEISLCAGKGDIKVINGTLLLSGDDAVGIRSTHLENAIRYIAELICRADSTSPASALQAYYGSRLSSVTVTPSGIDLNAYTDTANNVFNDGAVRVNGYEIVTNRSLVIAGGITVNALIRGNSYRQIEVTAAVPIGYTLAGIREIQTNHVNACHLTEFFTHPGTNKIGATFANQSSNNLNLTVLFEWFALRSNGDYTVPDAVVTLPDDDDTE